MTDVPAFPELSNFLGETQTSKEVTGSRDMQSNMIHKTSPLSRVISPRPSRNPDDEKFTRMLHFVFAILLTALSLFAGYMQYFAIPIDCWCPAHFTWFMVRYANSFCYFSNRYYMLLLETHESFRTKTPRVNYFKWTPFVLLFLAILYVIPEIVRKVFSKIFVLNLDNYIQLSRRCCHGNTESRDTAIQQLTIDLQNRLNDNETRSTQTLLKRWVNKGTASLSFYIRLRNVSCKLVYAIGAIIPIIFLHKTLGMNFNLHDPVTPNNITGNFPGVILCDFEVRKLQNLERFIVQCHIPANYIFERISFLIGFLALVVSSVSCSDVIIYVVTRLFQPRNSSYVNRHKLFAELSSGYDQEICRAFAERYLREDGVYLLQLIGQNSSEAVVCRILSGLWEGYKAKSFEANSFGASVPDCGEPVAETSQSCACSVI